MITPRESPSHAILERIADEYRRRGYEVIVEPNGTDLPLFLAGAIPDMIARRANERLVIEVKNSPSEVDRAQVDTIAQRIANEPGWQFVLMATGPQRTVDPPESIALDEAGIKGRLDEASALLNTGHVEAALMLAWAATEAVMRLLVAKHHLGIDRDDASTLIRSLVSEGYIDEDGFRLLNEAFRLRSAVAHGRRPIRGDVAADANKTARTLSQLSRSLLQELPASA
ncbi:MAG: hypothetical protein ABJF01_24755 [bacterium]